MRKVLFTALSVYASLALGIFLLVAPWTMLWASTTGWIAGEGIRELLQSGWSRGAISGIGVLHLLIAAEEALRLIRVYREP